MPLISPALATTTLLSLSVDLPVLNISYKLNHTIHALLWLASFTWHNVFEVRPHCGTCQHFIPFLWLNSILLYVYIICLSIHPLIPILVVSTFWPLGIVLLWTFMYIDLFWVPFFSFFQYIPRNRVVGSNGNSMFNFLKMFWGTKCCFPQWLHHFASHQQWVLISWHPC